MLKPSLKWFFVFCGSIAAVTMMWFLGIMQMLWDVDKSHLSFVTMAGYFGWSLYVGWLSAKSRESNDVSYFKAPLHASWFVSELMMVSGMAGTIVGFMYMLHGASGTLSSGVVSPEFLMNSALGLSTSCVTTLVGLVCCYLLRTQLVNLENEIGYAE
jgi:hypothetical protein